MPGDTLLRYYELQVKIANESLASMKKLQASAESVESQFTSLRSVINDFGKGLIGGALAGLSVGALVGSLKEAIKSVEDLSKAASNLGVGTTEFQTIAYAAKKADVSIGELESGLRKLQKSMSESGSKGGKILDALGIDKMQPATEVLKDFADKLQTIQDPALKTTAIVEVLGEAGLKMRGMLDQGREGIEAAQKAAEDLGLVLSSETIGLLKQLGEEFKKSGDASKKMSNEIITGLAPALVDLMKWFKGSGESAANFTIIGEALGVVLKSGATLAAMFGQSVVQLGTVLGGIAKFSELLVTGGEGRWQKAGNAFLEMTHALSGNHDTFLKNQKTLWGMNEATEEVTKSLERNSKATGENDGKVRAALGGKVAHAAASKQQVDEYAKLDKALGDQLFNLQEVGKETTAYDRAMRLLIASYEKLSPLERVLGEIRVEEIRIQEEINKTTKDTANARKEMEGITKGLMTAEEKYIADIERYMLLIAKVPDLEAAGVEAIKRRTEAYNDERDKMFKTAKDTDKMYDKLADKIDGYAKDISSTFIDFISNANDAKFSFSDFATSVLRDVAKMVTQFLIIEPLMSNLKKTLKDIDTGDQGGGGILAKIFRQMTGTPSYEGDFAYGAAFAHASPSLSRYSNGVYNRPRTFEFAKGAGVFAEAGPEAIMPLTRTASGELGVASTGGGDVVVNVINQAGADVAVKSSKSANGEREINIMVQQAVADGFSRGRFDGVMGATYGLSRRGR